MGVCTSADGPLKIPRGMWTVTMLAGLPNVSIYSTSQAQCVLQHMQGTVIPGGLAAGLD